MTTGYFEFGLTMVLSHHELGRQVAEADGDCDGVIVGHRRGAFVRRREVRRGHVVLQRQRSCCQSFSDPLEELLD